VLKHKRRCDYRAKLDVQTLVCARGRDFPLAHLAERLRALTAVAVVSPSCSARRTTRGSQLQRAGMTGEGATRVTIEPDARATNGPAHRCRNRMPLAGVTSHNASGMVQGVQMRKDAQYRRNAEQAQREADRSTTDQERASWLKIAEGWLSMLPRRTANTAEERFDDDARTFNTGHPGSNARH
jgi:hypothetical protein